MGRRGEEQEERKEEGIKSVNRWTKSGAQSKALHRADFDPVGTVRYKNFCQITVLLTLPVHGGLVCLNHSQRLPSGDRVSHLLLPLLKVSLQFEKNGHRTALPSVLAAALTGFNKTQKK
jgi:hypothetical protein